MRIPKIRMSHIIGLAVLVAIAGGLGSNFSFRLSGIGQLPGGSSIPYENGWEAKAGLAAVRVPGKATVFMDKPIFQPWQLLGSKGYSSFSADPDGQSKPYMGYPNLEIQVGDLARAWFLGSSGEWTKQVLRSDKIVVKDETGEHGYAYELSRYSFYVRISADADIRHVKTWAGANDRFETETTYDKGGSIPGTPVEVTVYPYVKIDPWDIRKNHSVGAWILKATLDHVDAFSDEVREKAQKHTAYNTGLAQMRTATGSINMYSSVRGVELPSLQFQPGVAPDKDLRTSVYLALDAKLLPGYYYDTWYADAGELHTIPRDIICKVSVEVLRTDNWEIQTTRHEPDMTRPVRDFPEELKQILQWHKVDPKVKVLLIIGLILAVLVILGPYIGLASVGLSTILKGLRK